MKAANNTPRPARVVHWESAGTGNELWLCKPSWDHEEGEWSLKCGHRAKNGNWAAPGEVPGGEFLLRGIAAAYENGYYTTSEILDHIKDLLDVVKENAP